MTRVNRYFILITRYGALTITGLCLLMHISGCSPEPAEHHVRDAVHAYFSARNHKVVKFEIQNIEREPLGARQYMGPKRYIVNIMLITLQEVKPESRALDYRNVTITLRKNTSSRYGWSVDDISGIPL